MEGTTILFISLWAAFGLLGWYLWDYELREIGIRHIVNPRDLFLLPIFFIITGLAGFLLALTTSVTKFLK